MKIKYLKVITLSLTILFSASQAMATGQTWFGKFFAPFASIKNSMQSFVKNNPKTSLLASVAIAAIVGLSIFACKKFKKNKNIDPNQNPENNPKKVKEKQEEKQDPEIEQPKTDTNVDFSKFNVNTRNPKKSCIVGFDEEGPSVQESKNLLNLIKDANKLENALEFKGEFNKEINTNENNASKHDFLLYIIDSRVTRLTMKNTELFKKLKNMAKKCIVVWWNFGKLQHSAEIIKYNFFDKSITTEEQFSVIPFANKKDNKEFIEENKDSLGMLKKTINETV